MSTSQPLEFLLLSRQPALWEEGPPGEQLLSSIFPSCWHIVGQQLGEIKAAACVVFWNWESGDLGSNPAFPT